MPLSPRVPDLAALDLLLTVGRLGSFGKAAREHGLSQQAVSARIRTAERLLGVRLLDRCATGVTPTADGAHVLQWARGVLTAADALDAGAAGLRGERNPQVTVAASMTVAEYLVPVWTVTMRAEHPEVSASVRLGNSAAVAALVRDGTADLGFVESPDVPGGLRSEVVGHDELVVIVPPGHRWSGRSVSVTELAATELIQREPGSGTRSTLERAVPGCAAPLLELSSTTAVKAAVIAGGAPAVLSSLAVGSELADGRLVAVDVERLRMQRTLYAVWPEHVRLPAPVRDFLAVAIRPG